MINIAIDGPSGAGKSTAAKAIAKQLNILYLDTGAMYRALALKAFRLGVDPNDKEKVEAFLPAVSVDVRYRDGVMELYLDGEEVSGFIREHHISKGASDISKIPAVRLKLVELQRAIAAKNDVVLDGRDITSYVLPNAEYKFYLTASPEVRAKRRYDELTAKGQTVSYEQILADVIDRDYNDMHRDFAPLVQTADSVLVDSSDMSADEVVELILSYVKR
ncbi:MAG: (d)CMP kinase [Clostridia bacterium]|nr:(d)CMP kinase [Clostridia bacterium]